MKGYAMLKIGESGWIEKERPKCGPMDAICRPLAVPSAHQMSTLYGKGPSVTVIT